MNPDLKNKLTSLLDGSSLTALSKQSKNLTASYQGSRDLGVPSLSSDQQRLAYLAARFPATYSAVGQVLNDLRLRVDWGSISSFFDMGAGPGTALLAAVDASFPIKRATLLERDAGFIALGKQLTEHLHGVEKTWICRTGLVGCPIQPHDLVVASYALNEMPEKERMECVRKLWGITAQFLVIVEPGSKGAFESLKKIREDLLEQGAYLVAPCPHARACPLPEGDWCHFAARVERSSLHRKVKGGVLNYEDEKFSWMAFSRTPVSSCGARLLSRPLRGKGHVKLKLCSTEGVAERTVTKKDKANYLCIKKREWGDFIDF